MKQIITAAIVAAVVSAGLYLFLSSNQSTSAPVQLTNRQNVSVYDRVMKSGELRCGYIVWPPEMNKDPATGELSGLSYDLIEEAAKRLDLKVDWVEETDFNNVIAGLNQNRFDMLCFTIYRRSLAAGKATHSKAIMYSGTGIFVRPDDYRFDKDVSSINDSNVTVATIDGEQAAIIADEQFQKAKRYELPALNDFSALLLSVAQNKADVSFANIGNAFDFMTANPGLVRQIHTDKPIRLFSHGFISAWDDGGLMKAFNVVFEEMEHHGFVEEALKKYQPHDGVWFKNAHTFSEIN